MIKERKERKMQEEGHCVEEATVTHYFPHRRQRWSSTFLCLREFGGKVPPPHTHVHTYTDRHSPFKQNMAPLFIATFIQQKAMALPLHCLLLSFTSLSFFRRSVWPKRSHTGTQIPTHTCTLFSPAASRHRPPSLSPLAHAQSGDRPTSPPQGTCLVTPRIAPPLSLSLYISLISENFSTMLARPLPKLVLRGRSPASV